MQILSNAEPFLNVFSLHVEVMQQQHGRTELRVYCERLRSVRHRNAIVGGSESADMLTLLLNEFTVWLVHLQEAIEPLAKPHCKEQVAEEVEYIEQQSIDEIKTKLKCRHA